MAVKQGPLSIADLLQVWVGAVDKTYSDPFIAAGEGKGLEAYTQGFAQSARVSTAIDVTTQALYILPHSTQTNPPAGGPVKATVTLTFTRAGFVDRPMRLGAGLIRVGEVATDTSKDGPVSLLSGRYYVLTDDVVFLPGETGPFQVEAQAERAGYGYNNPQPDTITSIDQPGTGFFHDRATVTFVDGSTSPPPNAAATLIAVAQSDMFVPSHVGQHVLFTAGANAGLISRMVGFFPPRPDLVPPQGSAVQLELLGAAEVPSITGTFTPGELLIFTASSTPVASAYYLVDRPSGNGSHRRVGYVIAQGDPASADAFHGATSGASVSSFQLLANPRPAAEAPPFDGSPGGASWRVLDWVQDFGLDVTHDASPVGGRSGMLDALGKERGLPRNANEGDEPYRKRISEIADVVSPNAILRALNRVLEGLPFCFREVGSSLLPGFFYDRTDDPNGDFYDDDVLIFTGSIIAGVFKFQEAVEYRDSAGNVIATGWLGRISSGPVLTMIRTGLNQVAAVNPGDIIVGLRSGAVFFPTSQFLTTNAVDKLYHCYLSYEQMRAFFIVCLPLMTAGEFGFAYDNHPRGAYDGSPVDDFWDGFPALSAQTYQRVVQTLNNVRAGGVEFDLRPIEGPCE